MTSSSINVISDVIGTTIRRNFFAQRFSLSKNVIQSLLFSANPLGMQEGVLDYSALIISDYPVLAICSLEIVLYVLSIIIE